MVRFSGYFCEVCSFLVLGMISYNIQPFSVDPRGLFLTLIVLGVSHYASLTGVMATMLRWVEPHVKLLSHNHVGIWDDDDE